MKTVKFIIEDWVSYKKNQVIYNFQIEKELPSYGVSYFQTSHQPSTYSREWRKHLQSHSYKIVYHPVAKRCKGWCIP